MKLHELRKIIEGLPDDWDVMYHAYDKGCCHAPYKYGWNYVDHKHKALILNPGDDYDYRKPPKEKKNINEN